MDWTLGVTDAFSLATVLVSMLLLTLFISGFWSIFFTVPDTKNKTTLYYLSLFLGSLIIAYSTFAYLVTLEINEFNYKNLQEKIEPYMADQKIKDLLNEAKKDGEISSAERDRLYHRVNQIKDSQLKKQVFEEGEIAKKLLLGKQG